MEISTDSDGVYYLDLVADMNYPVLFEKDGYYPETRQVYISQSPRLLNVALSPIPPPVAKFYMPPTMEAKIVEIWTMWPYYYRVNYRCEITNQGDVPGTQIITVSNNRPDWLEPWSFSITLAPGETYVWSYSQLAVSPLTFYLDGDWQGNNHSVGVPS
jgi:hypothetical protein